MITVRSSGTVYRNPKPEVFARHAWHPSLVSLGGREWLCTFDIGQAPEAHDYVTCVSRSSDDGQHWSKPERLVAAESAPRATHTIRVARLRDGTLLGVGARFIRADPEQGLINHPGLGYTEMELVTTDSADGRHWSPLRVIAAPIAAPAFETCHAPIQLSDGRILWPTSTWLSWDGSGAEGMRAVAFVSLDNGRSWPEYLAEFDDWQHKVVSWEQSVAELPDGRLVAVVWSLNTNTGRTLPTRFAVAAAGSGFGASLETGLSAQTMKIAAVGGSRLLAVYRRHDQPGLWASLVTIEGDGWRTEESAVLWDGAISGMAARGDVGRELSALQFGYPSIVIESEQRAAVAFWCRENDVFGIRLLRLDLDEPARAG